MSNAEDIVADLKAIRSRLGIILTDIKILKINDEKIVSAIICIKNMENQIQDTHGWKEDEINEI